MSEPNLPDPNTPVSIVPAPIDKAADMLAAEPDKLFKPLRWQAQDLVTSADMKALWLRVWRLFGWGLSLVFGLGALTGGLMTNSWTLNLAARIIVLFIAALEYACFQGHPRCQCLYHSSG